MSSILKALKRVEESGQAEETFNQPPFAYEASALRPSWRQKAWFSGRNRVYVLASVMVLAIAGAAFYRWTIDGAAPPAAGSASEVRAPLPPRPPDPPPQVASAPARPAPARPAPPPAQPSETVKDPVQAPPPTSRVRPREGSAAPPAETRPSPTRNVATPVERPDTGRPSPSRTPEDNLSRLDESKLKVMAIAWTAEPSRRLAVVNGHIVKEGESVEGFSVTQIRKDDIIVNDGGRSWRVELNLKRQP